MKKLKGRKLAAFALMFVLMLAGTVRLIAWAGDEVKTPFPEDWIEVDYVNETITVKVVDRTGATGTNGTPTVDPIDLDTIIYYTDKYNKDLSKWDACEVRNDKAVFDISWINDSKTVRLYLCGNNKYKKVVAVDLTWEENFDVDFTGTLLATDITQAEDWQDTYAAYPNFSEDTGYFIFTLEEDGRDNYYMDLDTIMWRKGNDGVWREFKELDLKEMNIRGIKLEFRIAASNGTDANGNDVPMARASSTAKYTVSKLSSAPQVAVNSDTMKVAIKNGMEFSFAWGPDKTENEEWIMIPEYSKKFGEDIVIGSTDFVDMAYRESKYENIYTSERVSELTIQQLLAEYLEAKGYSGFTMNSKMDFETLSAIKVNGKELLTPSEDGKGFILYVRECGTEKDVASKIAEVIIPCANSEVAKLTDDQLKDGLEITYGESKTNTGGIIITNNSDYKYQVAVLEPGHPDYPAAGATIDPNNVDISDLKWTSVKAGKTLKLANKKVPKDSYLIYRIAGENGELPSTYVVSEKMEYNALTYAGIAESKKNSGETLTAVWSTNLKKEDVIFQWQTCEDPKDADKIWDNIAGATADTFVLTNDQKELYVRVVITGPDRNPMESDYVGPIKATEPPADQNQNQNQQ